MLLTRLKALIASSLFLVASGGCFYFALLQIMEYFDWHKVIIFSWVTLFVLVFSPAFFIFAAAPGYVAINGKPMDIDCQRKISKALLYLFILAISGTVVFSFTYVSTLESKGYTKCTGIPSGWLPGTAVKYAVVDTLCKSKIY